VLRFVDLALDADRHIDRSFWLLTIADEINACANGDAHSLVHAAARRIHTTFRVARRERVSAVRLIIASVAPLG
jgi:hypothetical protein